MQVYTVQVYTIQVYTVQVYAVHLDTTVIVLRGQLGVHVLAIEKYSCFFHHITKYLIYVCFFIYIFDSNYKLCMVPEVIATIH